MDAPEWQKLARNIKQSLKNIGKHENVMVMLVYLNFFEINSTIFKEFHEIIEVLFAWLVMTTIGPDGLIQK